MQRPAAMDQAARALQLPVLVGIQGVMEDCAAHLCDGVPEAYLHSTPLDRALDRLIPGALLDKLQSDFDALARSEAALLGTARHVTGRTGFDRRAVERLAPRARYYPCNETLRPLFYEGPLWQPRDFGRGPVVLLSQGNYPLKNLHTVLQAMPAILQRWPDAQLRIAGWPPLDKGPLLRPLIARLFPYQRYCRRLAEALGVAGHIKYTGPLDAAAMRQAYLDADLFLLPSSSENSPNSLGEAMLLGLPCVASRAGGIPDMLTDGTEGHLYGQALDADGLARTVTAVLSAPDSGAALGQAARRRALHTHDPRRQRRCAVRHLPDHSAGGRPVKVSVIIPCYPCRGHSAPGGGQRAGRRPRRSAAASGGGRQSRRDRRPLRPAGLRGCPHHRSAPPQRRRRRGPQHRPGSRPGGLGALSGRRR